MAPEAVTLDKLGETISGAVTTGVAAAMKDILGQFNADLESIRSHDGSETEVQNLLAQFKADQEKHEEQLKEMQRALAEARSAPVMDSGPAKLRWPLEPYDLTMPAEDDQTRQGQKFNDEMYMMANLRGWFRTDGSIDVNLMKQGSWWKRCERRFGDSITKAIDTSVSGSGLEWVPPGMSQNLIDAVFIAARVAGLFTRLPMPVPSYQVPVQLARPKAYKATQGAARTEDTTALTDRKTFTAQAIAVYLAVTQESQDDMFMPILPWLMSQMAAGIADGVEACILNGDLTGTHMDTDINAAGADAVEKCWYGLRYRGLNTTGCKQDLATFNLDTLVAQKKAMSKYGLDPSKLAWIFGPILVNDLLLLRDSKDNAVMITMDKMGPNATVLTGQVGSLLGIPVITSASCREDTDATGVNGASGNTKATNCLVNRDAFFLGDRMSVTLEQQKMIKTQTTDVVASARYDFQHVFADAATDVNIGYNG